MTTIDTDTESDTESPAVANAQESNHLIGCSELAPGMSRAKYFEKLSLLEIDTFTKSKPTRKTVRNWRAQSPANARFSVLAATALSGDNKTKSFPVDEAGKLETATMVDFCEVLGAEAIVFRPPSSFSPSSQNRQRVEQYFGEIATAQAFGTTQRVWAPQGLWEPDTVAKLSEELDLLVALDPLGNDPFEEHANFVAQQMSRGRAYIRISGLGYARRRYDAYQLEMLADMLEETEKSWLLFGHPGKYPDALAMLREMASRDL